MPDYQGKTPAWPQFLICDTGAHCLLQRLCLQSFENKAQ